LFKDFLNLASVVVVVVVVASEAKFTILGGKLF